MSHNRWRRHTTKAVSFTYIYPKELCTHPPRRLYPYFSLTLQNIIGYHFLFIVMECSPENQRLIEDLLVKPGYNPVVRPAKNFSQPLLVTLEVALFQVISVVNCMVCKHGSHTPHDKPQNAFSFPECISIPRMHLHNASSFPECIFISRMHLHSHNASQLETGCLYAFCLYFVAWTF